jgi:hypothetical protein
MSRILLQQALDALKQTFQFQQTRDVIAALEAELAKPEQEPVAYADALDLAKDCNWDTFICKHASENHEGTRFNIPLYTAPPRKKWVGLTDHDIELTFLTSGFTAKNFSHAIEAKLKELNG